ncbi:hypothetical protein J4423_01865 [Candidatus Pacearchaeota archaeon]|nr:hypothetical protein [Candidatus Pacearchaeota archaeon]
MAKVVNVFPNSLDSNLNTLAELSVLMLGNISIDNPRRRGFKVLTVDSDSNGSSTGISYAKSDGLCYRRSREGLYVNAKGDEEKLFGFYSRFVGSWSWTKDKVVVPVRESAYELVKRLSERAGHQIREINCLDEISGFESQKGGPMIQKYNVMDILGL